MNKCLLEAAHGKITKITPIWLMRQAGRYLPGYQKIREKYDFLECCRNPELAARISLEPWREFEFDGVILFSDIMIPVEAMGAAVTFSPGPKLKRYIKTAKDIRGLMSFDPHEKTPFVLETLRMLKRELKDEATHSWGTLIGFCGAPWTLASYMVEDVRMMMEKEPLLFHVLLDKLCLSMEKYLKAQVEAGAEVIQIFDTAVEHLSLNQYQEFALPYEKRLVESLKGDVPLILFAKGGSRFLNDLKNIVSVLSVDHSVSIGEVRKMVGEDIVLQGNLDPKILASGTRKDIQREAIRILNEMKGQKHIFNLGHGVLPNTPISNVSYLVEVVRSWKVKNF